MMSGKACLSGQVTLNYPEALPPIPMAQISFDTPFYFLTSVTHHRLPIFQGDKMKMVLCEALNEARKSAELLIFAYVIMHDHFHIITDGRLSPSETLRYINGISARRIINFLKENEFNSSLAKLRQEQKKDGYKYSVWEHHSDKFLITSESMLMQKVNYVHNNPVEAGFVAKPEEYRYSSVRIWSKTPSADEPLSMDANKIRWRSR
jgi:putative transposase